MLLIQVRDQGILCAFVPTIGPWPIAFRDRRGTGADDRTDHRLVHVRCQQRPQPHQASAQQHCTAREPTGLA